MYSRSIVRSTGTLNKGIRKYASQASSGGGLGTSAYVLGAAGAAAGGYWYYSSTKDSPVAAAKAATSPVTASGETAFKGGDQGFLSLKLESVEKINQNTIRMRFDLPEADMKSGIPVASALITKYKGPEMEKAVIRPYTPVSDEDEPGHLDFVIKKYPNGPMSTHMHDMTPGQRLDIKGPITKYPVKENMHDEIALLCGGTGITPMYQVARAIFKNPNDKTKVTLVYGNLSEDDILLKKELNELENTYPQRFRAFYLLDNPPDGWTQGKGHINKDLLKTVLPEPASKNIKIFVCGPPGMYKAISGGKKSPQDQGELDGMLKELGYSKDQVFKF